MHIAQGLNKTVRMYGENTATVSVPGKRSLSWGEFRERAGRLAGALRELGLDPGARVAILALNSDRYLECYYGLPWAGLIPVPINTRLAVEEMVYIVNDAGCEALLVDEHFQHLLPTMEGRLETVRRVVFFGDGAPQDGAFPEGALDYEALLSAAGAPPPMGDGEGALAAIFYTGGTTGRPKGVMLSHRNLIVSAMSLVMDLEVEPGTIYLHTAPTFHVGDSAMTFAVTMKGGTHVVIPRFDPDHFLETVQTHRVTHCFLVPTMINMIVNHPRLEAYDLSSLRLVHYAGSPIATALLAAAMEALPGCQFAQGYGLTETSPVITGLAPRFHTFAGPYAGKIASAGLPAHHAEVKIVSDNGEAAAPGTVGEIVTRGLHVMMGYWNDAELSARTLRDGWMHTGDLGTLDEDGFLYVVDRLKDMIITGGENVYSAEVEGVLHKHPDVGMCAVIGVPDKKWGERVHAIVVPKPERAPGEAELLDHCRQHIAGYKCPTSIQIREEPLPLSGAGKILKHELRRDYQAQAGG